MVFDQPADASFSAVISGTGTLTKRGVGNLNLTSVSAMGGATTIEAGKLSVNGSLANSAVMVIQDLRAGPRPRNLGRVAFGKPGFGVEH
ncbi:MULTISPECIES: hypothetical protein [unclassified Mesorhizobium]|uniref:hypothetical protein n=1 Tax=unclassified Mesorhizobium TaxID=325217 RepID=UPI00142EE26F|nr:MULTISPECIES: hypothetical protein [unclassified Mesorhizobium]